jgi:hypothetical protein
MKIYWVIVAAVVGGVRFVIVFSIDSLMFAVKTSKVRAKITQLSQIRAIFCENLSKTSKFATFSVPKERNSGIFSRFHASNQGSSREGEI